MSFLIQLRHSLDLAVPRVVESPRPDQHDRYLGLLIFSSVLAVYLKTVAPTVAFGDSGELVTAAVTLGVPHPPGFPLYLLAGKLFTLVLPFGDMAFRLNVLSALFGALAATSMFFLVRALGQYKPLAVCAALYTGFLPAMWDHATEAGVQTMAAWFMVIALTLALHGARRSDRRLAALAFLAAGLGTAVDIGGLLVLPALLLVIVGGEQRFRRSAGLWVLCGLAFLLPLLLYLYIPLRAAAGPGLNWARPDSAERFFCYIRQGAWGCGASGCTAGQWWPAVREAASIFVIEFGGAGALLTIIGGWVLWVRRRAVLLALALLALLTLARAVVGGSGEDLHLMHRHLLPAWLAAAVCLAQGAQYLAGLAAHTLVREKQVPLPLFTGLVWLLLLAAPAARCLLLYPLQDKSGISPAADHGRNLLATLPDGAHLVTDDRLDLNPLLYLTRVEGLRPDLTIHDRAGDRFGDGYDIFAWRRLPPAERQERLDGVDAGIIAGAGGPVFYTHRVNRRVRLEQAGILLAVAGSGWAGDPQDLFRAYNFHGETRLVRGRIWREARRVRAGYRLREAEMYRSWGLDRQAGEALRQAVAMGHDSSWVLLRAARAHIDAGETGEAARLLDRVLASDPSDGEAKQGLAALHAAPGAD